MNTLNTHAKAKREALAQLVQDHQIQAGIALAVAMNVIHFAGSSCRVPPIWKVGDVIEVLKNKSRILISDPGNVLCCAGETHREIPGAKFVSRVAYIGAVVILAANSVDIQRQLREEPEEPQDPIINNPQLAELAKRIKKKAPKPPDMPW